MPTLKTPFGCVRTPHAIASPRVGPELLAVVVVAAWVSATALLVNAFVFAPLFSFGGCIDCRGPAPGDILEMTPDAAKAMRKIGKTAMFGARPPTFE
jgi:hypothetical protein